MIDSSSTSLSTQQLATATGSLPMFGGKPHEDVQQWLRLFRLTCVTLNLNEDHSKLLFVCALESEAKTWYGVNKLENLPLDEVCRKLYDRFDTKRNIPQAQELINSLEKSEDESWVGFVERIATIANRCELPEAF